MPSDMWMRSKRGMLRRMMAAVAGACLSLVVGPATAQPGAGAASPDGTSNAPPNATPADTASADLFARYVTPGQCQQAARRLQFRYWRDRRSDTVVYAPETDSVPTPVARAAAACVARFSVETTPVAELRNLAQVYLWTGQDSLAHRAVDRLLQADRTSSPRERGWKLSLWIEAALTAHPVRRSLVRAYLAQLDALGAPAATWRLFEHANYSEYALSVNDRVTAEAEGRAALAAGRQMSLDDRIDWVDRLIRAYIVTANPVALTRGGPAALALLDTMTTELNPLRPGLMGTLLERRTPYTPLGTRAWPAVQAKKWFAAAGDTVHPKPGRVSLVTFMYGADYPLLATLRRLAAAYEARGLDLVVLTSTTGSFRAQLMTSPAVEADTLGSYFRGYLHLPAAVAVEETGFTHLPDGRRQNVETPNQKGYGRVGGAILIDRQGVARWVGEISPNWEAVWSAVIESALR